MKKQDRQGVRTPADLERKYPFDKLSDLSKDYSSLRLEIMNALYDVSADLQTKVNETVETLEASTEAKIAEALADYVKTGDFEAFEDAVTKDITALELSLESIREDLVSFEEEIDGWSAEIGILQGDVAELQGDVQSIGNDVNRVSTDLQGLTNDINTHFDFKPEEGGLSIKGGLLPILIPANTDLDSLLIPNKYVGGTVTQYNYVNCPISSGTFSLDVESCGDEGQLKQTLFYSHKTNAKTYERIHYGGDGSWGEWVLASAYVTEGKLLWQGVYYMDTNHTATLSEAVSKQKSGIVLVFSPYDNGTATNGAWNCHFVPKAMVSLHAGQTFSFFLTTSAMSNVGAKSLVINDANIKGHEDSRTTGDISDYMQFQNNKWVLRYVFGV